MDPVICENALLENSEVVLDPEAVHEIPPDSPGYLVVSVRPRFVTQKAIQRRHPAESVRGIALRDSIGFDPGRPLHIVTRALNGTLIVCQRG